MKQEDETLGWVLVVVEIRERERGLDKGLVERVKGRRVREN